MHGQSQPALTAGPGGGTRSLESRWGFAADATILIIAQVLRLWDLARRPPHFDEGVNGWWVDQMLELGYYPFDSGFYHGPLFFYMLWASESLFGFHLVALRLPAVVASMGIVFVALAFRRFTGAWVSRVAAFALAVSPAFVFYGRYAIHETWMALFVMLGAWALLGLAGARRTHGEDRGQQPSANVDFVILCVALAGMVTTKETYVIHVGCYALAFAAFALWERVLLPQFAPARTSYPLRWRRPSLTVMTLGIAGALVAIVLLYSGFFRYPAGLIHLGASVGEWFHIGVGGSQSGHIKIPIYWLELMARYEWPALIGLAGAAALALLPSGAAGRWLAIYGAGVLLAYSLIPYKTPWCIISIIWPLYFTAAAAVGAMRQQQLLRGVACVGLAVAIIAGSIRAVDISILDPTDDEEPYIYVHTYDDVNRLLEPLREISARRGGCQDLRGAIVGDSYYPLPWLLRDVGPVGYFEDDGELPARKPPVEFAYVDGNRRSEFEQILGEAYFKEPLRIHSGIDSGWAYFRAATFAPVFPGRTPEFVPPQKTLK